jgi:hypothetical protein
VSEVCSDESNIEETIVSDDDDDDDDVECNEKYVVCHAIRKDNDY